MERDAAGVSLLLLLVLLSAEEASPSSIGCGVGGECRGGRRLSASASSASHFDCLSRCRDTPGCTHFTFFGGGGDGVGGTGVCLAFDGCPEVDEASACAAERTCVSGDAACSEEQCFFPGNCSL